MTKRIAIIQGHPDSVGHHLATRWPMPMPKGQPQQGAGHEVRRIEVAKLEFQLLRTQLEFETGGNTTYSGEPSGRYALGRALVVSVSALAWNHAGASQGFS